MRRFVYIFLFCFLAFGSLNVFAQGGADNRPVFAQNEDRDLPKSARESMEKLRIEKERKNYEEMLQRGEDVRKLAERLEKSLAQNGRFSETDREALATLEKNVKKIRSELGGDDDDEKLDDVLKSGANTSIMDAFDALKNAAISLTDELKKTSRFTISATAIQSSNAVLTVARFLRIRN